VCHDLSVRGLLLAVRICRRWCAYRYRVGSSRPVRKQVPLSSSFSVRICRRKVPPAHRCQCHDLSACTCRTPLFFLSDGICVLDRYTGGFDIILVLNFGLTLQRSCSVVLCACEFLQEPHRPHAGTIQQVFCHCGSTMAPDLVRQVSG
jgi:hypothetical protein